MPANWSANRVPGESDHAFITLAGTYTVTLNATANIAALTIGGESGTQTLASGNSNLTVDGAALVEINGVIAITGGSFSSLNDLTIEGALNWTAGLMTGTGHTIIAEGATLNINGNSTKYLDAGRVLENHGTILWTSGNLDLNAHNGGGSGRIENTASGLFEIQISSGRLLASGHADLNTEPLPAFNNAGTLRKSTSDSSIDIGVRLTNTGITEVWKGILNATAPVTFTSDSMYRFVISGPTSGIDYGRLHVNGTLTLRGSTEFVLANDFVPAGDQEFTMITAGSLIATFSEVQGNVLPNALYLNPVYSANSVIVQTQDARPILQSGIGTPHSQFRINGIAGQMYRIYSASDLGASDWELIATVTLPGIARLDFVDPEAADFPYRFYIVEFATE